MVSGILEVFLVDARGLGETDLLSRMDPYVLIQYRGQEHKSSVAQEKGRNPVWNERFTFRAQYPGVDDQYKLVLRIMDRDTFSSDDFVGEASIHLKDLLALGAEKGTSELHPRKYSVVQLDKTYCGDIRVGITFTPKVEEVTDREDYGGWKQSN
ncbi:hypothetical protein GIB67_011763 [Kingdonia uniflora]|uniref:C2 domain-containing protein n=1 Tax=Kingdonia uniflora TaxID=39325 RepID=A0A7J7NXC9_9MAGN|nr:hypothetical protein GIB67_011763 [Kingdonia uniflora]